MHTLYLNYSSSEQTLTGLADQVQDARWDAPYLRINSGSFRADCALYDDLEGLSIAVNDFVCKEAIKFVDQFSEEASLIVRFMHSADVLKQNHGNPETAAMNAGILIHNHLSPMSIAPPVNQHMRWLVLRIQPQILKILERDIWSLLGENIVQNEAWVMYESVSYEMHKILRKIWQIQSNPLLSNGITTGYSIILLSLLMEQMVRHRKGPEAFGAEVRHLDRLLAIKSRLLQNLENPPGKQELSREFGWSATQLGVSFKKMFGMPPHKFVLFEKYKEAHRRVRESDQPLSEIALELGFSNLGHFSKGFKNHYDMSPSQLRKNDR